MNPYFATLLAYSAVLIAVGWFASRKVRSAGDFLVAGRRLGPGVIFATFLAANIGAGSTVGAAGLGYRFGLAAWWWVGSAGIGCLILASTVGPRLWQVAKARGLETLGDYLDVRYHKAVKAVIAVILWFGTLAILAGQLMAISWVLAVVIGLPKWQGCLAGGVVAIAYCAAGGLASSAIVNIVELSVTMTGLGLSAIFAMRSVGGWSGLTATLAGRVGGQASAQIASHAVVQGSKLLSFTGAGPRQILAYIAILVPSFIVSPGLVQKLYGARDAKAVRVGVGLNAVAQLAFAFVPAMFGLVALARFPGLTNPELALPTVLVRGVPPWLGLWALAAVFSAELSATDAILFMLSTSLAVDLYRTFIHPGVTTKRLLAVSRWTTVLAGCAGIALAIVLPSVIAAVSIFYGLLAVALFVPVVLGLYWPRMGTPGALASIFSAIAADLAAHFATGGRGLGYFSPPAVGIFTGLIVALAVTMIAPRRSAGPLDALGSEGAHGGGRT
ncbi:MAG: sodium:solute symporter family protein [Candidatus Acidiferrales bacterium]